MSFVAQTRARLADGVRRRAAVHGKAPRLAYTHYFIETDGLHSRIHLQNFYSTFWPQIHEPATAHITVFDAGGRRQGVATRTLPPFGSMFLKFSELLAELASTATEGMVAIDLAPAAAVAAQFHELPDAEQVEIRTPFWMAYYDGNENFMYVHSIDTLGGEVFGAPPMLRWAMTRYVGEGKPWHSWRLLEADNLADLQIICMNTSPEVRRSTVGVYSADGAVTLYESGVELASRSVARVRVPAAELEAWPHRHPDLAHVRIGMNPLLTANGKPYVLMRYVDGPPSLHHG